MASSASHPTAARAVTWEGLAYLFVVYVAWSSTYLAIRIAVREGGGFPPFSMAASRFILAGGLLLLWSLVARKRLRLSRAELAILSASGACMMLGGNGLVTWAEQRAHSGYAALLVACAPIWVSLLEAGIDRRRPSGLLVMALVVGLSGVGVLSAPVLLEGNSADAASVAALLAAGALWGMGTLLQHRRAVSLDPMTSSGYQQVLGAAFLIAVSLLAREPLPAPSGEATVAWGYLVIFGSLVAFTCFVRSLQLLPASVAMTYAYVNPVGAVLLGWLVLGEPITPWTIGGAALVLLGVAGVFRSKGL